MILTEYNEELHIRSEKALSYQQGEKRSADRINALHNRLLKENRLSDLQRATEDAEYQKKLMEEYGID